MPFCWRVWLAFFGMGILNNAIPFTLIVWGQTQISSGLASILNATTPLFAVVVAHVQTQDEKMSGWKVCGVVAGLIGVVILFSFNDLDLFGGNSWAQIACLAAGLSYAFASVFGRRFAQMGVSPMATATGQVTASSVILVPIMLIVDQPWALPMPDLPTIGSLIGLALLCTTVAYILYFKILAIAGATNLSLVTFLVPIFAILLGGLFFGRNTANPSDFWNGCHWRRTCHDQPKILIQARGACRTAGIMGNRPKFLA